MSEEAVQTQRSFCRICTSLCGILVDTQGDRVLRVRGDHDHPLSRGYTCPKGRALTRVHHHPQRLERPLMRTGAGGFEATSWDSCLDDLADKLRAVIDRHGPSAVGIYFGSGLGMDAAGYRLSERLHAAIGTPARFSPLTIDGTAKVLVTSLMSGTPALGARPDYDTAKLVIFVGINPVVSHGHAISMPMPPSKTVQAVTRRGETWVIDPRFTETARFASRHLAPRPGKDYAIFAYLVRELLIQGACPDILAHRSIDAEVLRGAVAPYHREHAARVAGVDPCHLTELLAAVRRAGRVAVDTGTGVTMTAEANVTQWLAWALMILTDSMNRPGGVWFHPGFFRPLDAAPLPRLPREYLFPPGPPSRPELRGFLGEWPCAALPDEIEAGNIRAFLNLGGNLVTAFPDENALRPALRKLEVFATLEIVANETTALSTHVLPTKDQLERPDVTLWDGLSSRVSAQYTAALVPPLGDRRASWWILAELMRRLGHEPPVGLPADDRAPGADDAAVALLAAQGGRCDYGELRASGYAEVERPLPAPWVDEFIEGVGGWQLAPEPLVEQLADLARDELPGDTEAVNLLLTPRRQQRHVNAQLVFLGDVADALLHPEDAAALGIEDGAQVAIASSRGAITCQARVDSAVRRGVVSVPHGFEGANVNALTDAARADPITGMALYSGFPVTVRPAAQG